MFLVEQILASVAKEQSPVEGEDWPKLDKDYKKHKVAEGLPGKANLESSGELLDALTYKTTKTGVEVGFFNSQAWKADGHLKFSGAENNIPQRRFLPAEGQSFKRSIQDEVNKIIIDAKADTFKKSDLREIETKSELYSYLEETLGLESRSEIRMAVLRNEDLFNTLDDLGLVDLL